MYYIRLGSEDSSQLIYYCRKCGHEDSTIAAGNACVLKTSFAGGEAQYGHIVNRYTKLDPTLPRTDTIKCPSQTCPGNAEGAKQEVIYIRYDDTGMKYLYLCANCDTVWKTGEQS
jgi:DNA-directed RNA polymerase subunit M/transcription elongation factor TFIIS